MASHDEIWGGVGTMDQISFKLVPRGISYGVSNIVGAPVGCFYLSKI